jgi:hypothetical protein
VAFADRVEIELTAGRGGNGCASFARAARDPLAGPDGGDGGRGGDVILSAKGDLEDLEHLANVSRLSAENGKPGESKKRYGKDASYLVVDVPPGTRAVCLRSGVELACLIADGDSFTICAGGKGGRGNVKFATATRRSPNTAQQGADGDSRFVELVYRQPAPIALLESTQSAGDDYYFRLYAHLSGNKSTGFHFYLRKPRRFFFEQRFRKYPMAFLPFLLKKRRSDNTKFPNLAHLYFVRIAVAYFGGLDVADTGAVLRRMLDDLGELPHPHLAHFIAVAGGARFEANTDLIDEWRRMCDNHPALDGVENEIVVLSRVEDESGSEFAPVLERIVALGAGFARGD